MEHPNYTTDEFFAAISAASRKKPPVNDPRWQRIPREIIDDGEIVDDAKKAIQELSDGNTDPL